MLTRKDYRFIAEAIASQAALINIDAKLTSYDKTLALKTLRNVTERMAFHFQHHYPTFNREKFMLACGWTNRRRKL